MSTTATIARPSRECSRCRPRPAPDGSPRSAIFGQGVNDRLPYTVIPNGGLRFPYELIDNGLYQRRASGFELVKTVKAGFAMLSYDWGDDGRLKTLIGFRYDDMFNSNDTLAPVGNTDELRVSGRSTNHVKVWSKSIGAVYELTPWLVSCLASFSGFWWFNCLDPANRFGVSVSFVSGRRSALR